MDNSVRAAKVKIPQSVKIKCAKYYNQTYLSKSIIVWAWIGIILFLRLYKHDFSKWAWKRSEKRLKMSGWTREADLLITAGRIVKIGDPNTKQKLIYKLCLSSIVIKCFSYDFLLFGLGKRDRQINREESGNYRSFLFFFFSFPKSSVEKGLTYII